MRVLPARERIALPLDVPDVATASRWIAELSPEVGLFKVGLELFTATGPASVHAVHEAGARCFLDLKLHDIPATMAGAAVAGGISMAIGCKLLVPHGGIFVMAIPNAINHGLGYLVAIVAGTLETTALLFLLKKPQPAAIIAPAHS